MSGQEKPNFEKIEQNQNSQDIRAGIQPKVSIIEFFFTKLLAINISYKIYFVHFALKIICNLVDNEEWKSGF